MPDADMLISLADALETPVSTLLGETVSAPEAENLKAISAKLEVINLQLARRKEMRRKMLRGLFIALGAVTLALVAVFAAIQSSYLGWSFSDPETAVAGTILHGFEWLFVRAAPFVLIAAVIGVILTRKRS